MRRPLLLLSIALLAGALLLRRRSRRAAVGGPAAAPAAPPPVPPAPASAAPRFMSVPWTLVAADQEAARLTIRYAADAHMQLDRVDAQETPTQVFVTVMTRWQPPSGGWFAFEDEREAVVELSRPLGERELVHAPVDVSSAPPLYP